MTPYSKNDYPDFTILNKTLQTYEFAQIRRKFEHADQFSVFLNRMELLILSYPKINELEWHRCAKRIDALFPKKTEDEKSAFTEFKIHINCKFQFIIVNSKKRYDEVSSCFLPNQEKAEILQKFLNTLIVEEEFLSIVSQEDTIRTQCKQLGIVLESTPKRSLVKVYIIARDVIEKAKSMLKPYKDIHWGMIHTENVIFLHPEANNAKVERHLKALLKKSPPQSLKVVFEKLIIRINQVNLEKKINHWSGEIKAAYENLISLKKSLVVYSNELPKRNLWSEIAPALYHIKRYLKCHYNSCIQEYPPNLQSHTFLWEKTQNTQINMFNFLLHQLEFKVKDLGKKGAPFFQDLTHKSKPGILRPYPDQDNDTIKRIKSYINTSPVKTFPQKFAEKVEVIKAIAKPKPNLMDLQFAHKMVSVQCNKQVTPNPVREETRLIKAFPGQKFPFKKDTRLKIWENHPFETPLLGDAFKDYSHLSLEEQVWQHIYHAPHPLVDRFIHLGVKGVWESEDLLRHDCRRVLAEIEYKGEVRIGCFEFNIIFDRACYHRGFNTKLEGEWIELHAQKLQEKTTQANRPEYVDKYKTWVKTDTAGNVEIFDTEKNLRIKLFNLQIVY